MIYFYKKSPFRFILFCSMLNIKIKQIASETGSLLSKRFMVFQISDPLNYNS